MSQKQAARTKGLGGVIESKGVPIESIIFFCEPLLFSDSSVLVVKEGKLYNLLVYNPSVGNHAEPGLIFVNKFKGEFQAIRVALAMCEQPKE